jgi:hypothetical protein
MNKRRLIYLGVLLLAAAVSVSAQNASGRVSYLEGSVQVSRGGAYMNSRDVGIGLRIEESDTVETGTDGYVEIEMTAPSAGSVVKVSPNSAFYFENTPPKSSRIGTMFQLLRGSLGLKVGKLSGRESYGVRTDSAVMAVRGTEFNVDIAPDRSVLVSVPEGRVESESGTRTIVAQPGVIAAVDEKARISAISVEPEDIDLYRQYWQGLRLEALKVNARLSIQQYARLWVQQRPRLENAMREVLRQEQLLRKWEQIAREGGEAPPMAENIRDRQALSPSMMELRAILPVAERTFNTLVGLEDAYLRGYAQGMFQAGNYADAAAFYREFSAEKARIKDLLVRGRWLMRVYRLLDPDAPDIMSGPAF